MDRLHHPLEDGVQELPRLLGVAVGEQFHRALQVGEEHGHLLALAFEGDLGGENLLGEMLGSVGLRRSEALLRDNGLINRMGALRAELRRRRELAAALLACPRQRNRALFAELGLRTVLVLTPRTLHHGASVHQASTGRRRQAPRLLLLRGPRSTCGQGGLSSRAAEPVDKNETAES
jgi:hypothetical protein